MKFLETYNSTFINVDDINSIYHEEINDINFSFLDVNGEKYTFLETQVIYLSDGVKKMVDVDALITLHRIAAQIIASWPDNDVIEHEKLEELVWIKFEEKLNK